MASKESVSVNVVPWFNAAQFKKVYEYLYSNEITKKKWAVDTISVWETRCHPSLPTAIEATYVLTSAVIQDILWTNKTTLIHYTDLQGIYGSAITRFVNIVVEANKIKGCPSFSTNELAKSIGVPSFIVDIRNEWSHTVRPSLSVLRLAAQSALKYLKESYWEKEAALVNNYVKQPMDDTGFIRLFVNYIKFHEDPSKDRVIQADDGSKRLHPEYTLLMKRLEKGLKKNKRDFVNVLIYEGIFIPKDEDVRRAIPPQEYRLFDIEYALVDDEDDDDDDDDEFEDDEMSKEFKQQAIAREVLNFESKNFPNVPKYHEDLWNPVIALLNRYDVVPLFMEKLLQSQANRTVVGQKLLIAWILKILKIHSQEPSEITSSLLKKTFLYKAILPNWLRMLHSAMVNPCKYTLIVLPRILSNCDFDKKEVHRILGLMSLKLGMVPIQNRKTNYWKLYHTASDLKEALEYQRNCIERERQTKNIEQSKENEINWEPCPDDCHKFWPIGYIVNAVKDADNEEEMEGQIFEWTEEMKGLYGCEMPTSNKNEDDYDEDETCKMNEEPDLSQIMLEIDRRETVLLKRSG